MYVLDVGCPDLVGGGDKGQAMQGFAYLKCALVSVSQGLGGWEVAPAHNGREGPCAALQLQLQPKPAAGALKTYALA